MSLSSLLIQANDYFINNLIPKFTQSSLLYTQLESTNEPYVLFFSLSDGKQPARIIRATGKNPEDAFKNGRNRCQTEARRRKLNVSWLRIDWPTEILATDWQQFEQLVTATRRNYFRYGIALDKELKQFFLEGEINANAMLYLGGNSIKASINIKNFTRYAYNKFGKTNIKLPFDREDLLNNQNKLANGNLEDYPIFIFAHQGIFVSDDATQNLPGSKITSVNACHLIESPAPLIEITNLNTWKSAQTLDSGRRQFEQLDADQVMGIIESSANFLSTQVKRNGEFIYGHFPNFGKYINTYNTLRHASSIYSMAEALELMPDNEKLLQSIKLSLDYLDKKIIRRYPQEDGTNLAFNVDINNEIKLGANAVSILAFVKYEQVTGDKQYRELMEQLALGIIYMQQGELDANYQPTGKYPGKFVHILNAEDLSIKDAYRIVYYDGEAAFGLMRLYGLTQDKRWLETVEKAFEFFIEADHWRHHDHWLSYCANELTLYNPDEKYFRFGVQNIANYLDFILERETTYPTLLELSMAFEAMLVRIQTQHPEMQHLLKLVDVDKFYRALHHRAHYLLNGFYWPEMTMYIARPDRVVGSFFIRHHAFRVRIDDIEHYLSGYIAYRKMLLRNDIDIKKASEFNIQPIDLPTELKDEKNGCLAKDKLVEIRGGRLFSTAAIQWNKMRKVALQDGINLLPQQGEINTYRSIEVQEKAFLRKYAKNLDSTESYFSSYGLGLAIDIELDKNHKTLDWLKTYAHKFGFCWEYDFEPWHLVYFTGDSIPTDLPTCNTNQTKKNSWCINDISNVISGQWLVEPKKDSILEGITSWLGSHQDNNFILVAKNEQEKGVKLTVLKQALKNNLKYAGLITSMNIEQVKREMLPTDLPIYQVNRYETALYDLANYSRSNLSGTNIAVTGSAGKSTSVNMLSEVFSSEMKTSHTRANANLPFGVAWNLCQTPWNSELNIFELAIGQMIVNTNLVKPKIAIITNIAPAHLIYHKNTATIALRKSRIFMGVEDDGWAVICRDTEHFELIKKQAALQRLNILTYGEHLNSDIRMTHYEYASSDVEIIIENKKFNYSLPVNGRHIALNSLACLAVAKILNIKLDGVILGFKNVKPVEGRGTVTNVKYDNKNISIYNEAYNANPLSMKSSLEMFAHIKLEEAGRKILVLGDMLELGDDALKYHQDLVNSIVETKANKVYLVGNLMPQISDLLLAQGINSTSYSTADEMLDVLKKEFADNDHILFKSSNGIGLVRSIDKLIELSSK